MYSKLAVALYFCVLLWLHENSILATARLLQLIPKNQMQYEENTLKILIQEHAQSLSIK